MTLPVRILNNKHNFRVSLQSDRVIVGMLRVSRSVSKSELHDLEQILRANFCKFSSARMSFLRCGSQTGQAYSMCGLINDSYSFTRMCELEKIDKSFCKASQQAF